MTINSTWLMLASMAMENTSQSTEDLGIKNEAVVMTSQLKPAPDMEQVLSNILGLSAPKEHSPMD